MGWGDHVRGIVIAVALVAHGIYALPLPHAVTAHDFDQDEWRQHDLELWQSGLGAFGIDIEIATLETIVIDATRRGHALHRGLKWPFAPLFEFTGTNQAWALFASATVSPETIAVQIRTADPRGDWTDVARRLDPDAPWLADVLRYRRIRGLWDGQKERVRPGYRNLTKWLARRALDDFPEAEAVRIRLERGRSTYPWEDDDPEIELRHARVHTRERLQ